MNSLGRWLCLVCAFGFLLVFDSNAPSERKNSKTEKWRCKTNISEQKKNNKRFKQRKHTHTLTNACMKSENIEIEIGYTYLHNTQSERCAPILLLFFPFFCFSLYIFYIKQHQQATNTQNHAKEMKIKVKLKIVLYNWCDSRAPPVTTTSVHWKCESENRRNKIWKRKMSISSAVINIGIVQNHRI